MRKGARATALLLVIILALAFGLRLAGLGRQSLWYDEGVSAYLTTLPVGEMLRWTAEDIQPPLYYALLAGWTQLFGRSEAALRWPSVLFSLLTVGLAWLAGLAYGLLLFAVARGIIFTAMPSDMLQISAAQLLVAHLIYGLLLGFEVRRTW